MRYTLRLLTLDQLSRAATLICALELERHNDPDTLGPWPFEIGLWVGRAATPNKMGFKGDNNPNSARSKTIAFQNDDRKPAPIPLENCPWCGEKFKQTSFQLLPNANEPADLRVVCANKRCDFIRNQPLPIVAVDEPIYRRLAVFPDRHGGQVRGYALDRPGRCFLRPRRPLRPARLLRTVRERQREAATGAAPAARPGHPGRAAPDLGTHGNHGRAL